MKTCRRWNYFVVALVVMLFLVSGCSNRKTVPSYVGEISDMIDAEGKVIGDISQSPYVAEIAENIQAVKLSSHSPGETVHPGSEISFAIVITNAGKEEKSINIKDAVPEHTEFVGGCDNVDNGALSWRLTVPGNSTAYVPYVVRVKDDLSLCDGRFVYSQAIVQETELDCQKIFIARTFNEFDREKMAMGIKAMSNSEHGGIELAKRMYTVAFSKNLSLNGTAAELLEQIYVLGGITDGSEGSGEEAPEQAMELRRMTAPALYGGKTVNEEASAIFLGDRIAKVTMNDLIVGDIVLIQRELTDSAGGEMYICTGDGLKVLSAQGGAEKTDEQKVLEGLSDCDRYAVLRPSMVLDTINYTEKPEELELTPEQEAIVETAKAYLLRGDRLQYDDSWIGKEKFMGYRWQVGLRAPEEYTSQAWGYTNCAAFAHDVYQFALGYDVGVYTTYDFSKLEGEIRPFHALAGQKTEEEMLAIEKAFKEELQPGDIIILRRRNGSGHAMLYIGNGDIIHSGGSSYNLEKQAETYEPTVRYMRTEMLFRPESNLVFFDVGSSLSIIRPLNMWTGGVPEETVCRVQNMKGIVAEKLSSHTAGMMVNPGDKVEFKFSVYNTNDHEVVLEVKDTVPENTTYVKGADKRNGDELFWQIKVPAGETVCVSYMVKVKPADELSEERVIRSDSGTVGGVAFKCPDIHIRRSLSEKEQEKLLSAIEAFENSELKDVALLNGIYEKVFGQTALIEEETLEALAEEIYIYRRSNRVYLIKEDSKYVEMVVPTLYGGRSFFANGLFKDQCRLVRQQNLLIGDILLARKEAGYELYLYNGECLLNLSNGMAEHPVKETMEQMLAYDYYYVMLRPSAMMGLE